MSRARLILLLASAWLAGCALFPTIEPGATTEAEILATYGQPSRRWPEADGGVTLEYATQPEGNSCFMVTVDRQGRVVNVRDALTETNQARVEIGMSEAQVDRLLGRHRSVQHFVLSGETVWDWSVPSAGLGELTRFNVHFKEGRVVRTSRSMAVEAPFFANGGVIYRPPAYLPCPRCIP